MRDPGMLMIAPSIVGPRDRRTQGPNRPLPQTRVLGVQQKYVESWGLRGRGRLELVERAAAWFDR